jgi:hypothetical protein
MKNKTLIIIISLAAILILIASYFYFKKPENTAMSEAVAIETLKTKFPELKDYPSDGSFPVKSIKTEQTSDGWYIAFIQEGSGVPIVGAQCFLIKNNKDTEQITYTSDDVFSPGEFSVKECRVIRNIVGGDKDEHGCIGSAGYTWCEGKQKCLRTWEESCEEEAVCKLENCHGLDIKCGPNPPDYCTAIYGIGDKCLQYAKCGIQNGTCQQIIDLQFTQCKSCVEDCIENNKNDSIKSFECESRCN